MSAFDKIIGYTLIKEELKQIADCLKNTAKYRRRSVSIPKGLLLEGEPGVGKTLMTMCLVEESGRKAFICRKDKHNGDFVEHILETFEDAEENAPSIVVLDDMDKFADTEGRNSYAEEYVTVQSCIDRVRDKGVFVAATVNNAGRLPDSLTRHGRFDVRREIERPKLSETEQIIRHYLSRKPKVNADTKTIAELISGETGATLETVINEAGLLACYEDSEAITTEHIIKAILRTVYHVNIPADMSSLPKIDLSDHHYDSERIYHEAGHAVMREILQPDSTALIATFCEDDSCFVKRIQPDKPLEIIDKEIKVLTLVAGKAAVEVRFGISGTGGVSDYEIAARYIRGLAGNEAIYGFNYLRNGNNESDLYLYHRNQAVGLMMTEYYNKAKKLLTENRTLLDRIAEELSIRRYLIGDDIRQIKNELQIMKEAS